MTCFVQAPNASKNTRIQFKILIIFPSFKVFSKYLHIDFLAKIPLNQKLI
ncbi:hypothetical protein LEP1GSC072_1944 [Leptospira noguchii str. Bonito]|nr:hypothetical protein LEP1GSC072_1944 [Leptospira noguchii str. Bonito]